MLAARYALHAALQIRGLTKKGKEFYRFTTNLTEQLRTLHVCDSSVWVTGEFLVTEFQDSKEVQFYTAPDRIHDADVSRHRLAARHPAASTVACICILHGFNQADVSKVGLFTALGSCSTPPHPDPQDAATIV